LRYAIEGRRQARLMRLGVKQHHALAVLAATGPDGATQSLLTAHGCSVSLIAGLVKRGLATLTHEQVKTGGKLVEVARVRITQSGRDALAAEAERRGP
jgi:hypothetical protein